MRTNASARATAATSTIAVDLGATAVRVVEMDFDAAGHATIGAARSCARPAGIVERPEFQSRGFEQRDNAGACFGGYCGQGGSRLPAAPTGDDAVCAPAPCAARSNARHGGI